MCRSYGAVEDLELITKVKLDNKSSQYLALS